MNMLGLVARQRLNEVTLLPSPPYDEAREIPTTRRVQAADGVAAGSLLDCCRQATQRLGGTGLGSLGVTSTVRGEGRTSVAARLALVQWLDHDKRTVLLDLDLTQPSLHEHFGLADGPGICELIEGQVTLDACLQCVFGDLWILPSGRPRRDASWVLSRLSGSAAMAQLAEWADVVVCDLPPLLTSSTGLQAARLCSRSVLVVRAGVTPLARVREASNLLECEPAVILNGTRSSVPRWIRRAMGDWA